METMNEFLISFFHLNKRVAAQHLATPSQVKISDISYYFVLYSI